MAFHPAQFVARLKIPDAHQAGTVALAPLRSDKTPTVRKKLHPVRLALLESLEAPQLFPGLDVPEPDVGVSAGQHFPAVLREYAVAYSVGVLEEADHLGSGDVPQPCGVIPAARESFATVRRERHAQDRLRVSLEAADFLARSEVP